MLRIIEEFLANAGQELRGLHLTTYSQHPEALSVVILKQASPAPQTQSLGQKPHRLHFY